jgi:hypothetical protein
MLTKCKACKRQAMESCCKIEKKFSEKTNSWITSAYCPSCATKRLHTTQPWTIKQFVDARTQKHGQQSKDRTCTFCPQQVLCLTLNIQTPID